MLLQDEASPCCSSACIGCGIRLKVLLFVCYLTRSRNYPFSEQCRGLCLFNRSAPVRVIFLPSACRRRSLARGRDALNLRRPVLETVLRNRQAAKVLAVRRFAEKREGRASSRISTYVTYCSVRKMVLDGGLPSQLLLARAFSPTGVAPRLCLERGHSCSCLACRYSSYDVPTCVCFEVFDTNLVPSKLIVRRSP